jgi:hypothetical protein
VRLHETHRLTLALDTTLVDGDQVAAYIAPTSDDIQAGAVYRLATRADQIGWFPELPWVSAWIDELFDERAALHLRLDDDELEAQRKQLMQQAHYLNLLALIGAHARVPEIKLIGNQQDAPQPPVPVDLILDIGNSRTCGILIEEHRHEDNALAWAYELGLRDLSEPHRVYTEPFESRLEFAEASFGKQHIAHKSGRADAFLWPTMARIGPEAARLAGRRRGTEGATGLSSPKRYLWDLDRFTPGWRFNKAFVRSDIEPHAVTEPLCNLINELGEPLYTLAPEERIPVLRPSYSRSATMTLMLCEVVAQALCQINSAAQRLRMLNGDLPRILRSLILTVPPSMPRPERELLEQRAEQALGLIWRAYDWVRDDNADDELDAEPETWPPLPRVEARWDEATCAQLVYLFTEIQETFSGRPEDLIATLHHPAADASSERLRVASIDIGGGTTDLVINDYLLSGSGTNVSIIPQQRFRDGFKIAGDDLLLDCIRQLLVPALRLAWTEAGIADPQALQALLSGLIGADPGDVQEKVLKAQLTQQVLYPAGLAILARYEHFDPVRGAAVETCPLGELIAEAGGERPTDAVLEHVQASVRELLPETGDLPGLLALPVAVDLARLHRLLTRPEGMELAKPLDSLCEVVNRYACDVLLLTGRPSRLPGIRERIASLLPLPPDRVLCMNEYRTGTWYPFHHRGRIRDPKTTAAVGAMLCVLGQGRLHGFFLRANELKPYSTVRYLGLVDLNLGMRDADLVYRDIDLDDDDYQLPDERFPFRGRMRLGYRQLDIERWTASPLYVLDFGSEAARERLFPRGGRRPVGTHWLVRLERTRRGPAGLLRVAEVSDAEGGSVPRDAVQIKLSTLVGFGTDFATHYWLDSGIIERG